MELTKHGKDRIQGRTKLLDKDVLSIISEGAVVELGIADEKEFLLFYSPFDERCKIAIVSKGRRHLISIWGTNFHLPEGIRKPTKSLNKSALTKYRNFAFKKATGMNPTPPVEKLEKLKKNGIPQYPTRIKVVISEICILEEEGDALPFSKKLRNARLVPELLVEQLKKMTEIVESKENIDLKQTYYTIEIRSPTREKVEYTYRLSHKKIKKILGAA